MTSEKQAKQAQPHDALGSEHAKSLITNGAPVSTTDTLPVRQRPGGRKKRRAAEAAAAAAAAATPPAGGGGSAPASYTVAPSGAGHKSDTPPPTPSAPAAPTAKKIENENPYLDFVVRYRDDPVGFVQNVLGASPLPWQQKLMAKVASGERRISVRAGHGVGKALHVEEPVLTPTGWVPIGQIKTGDLVCSADGTFTPVTGVYPQGQRELFRVTLNDGSSVLADKDHLWTTWTREARKRNKPHGVRTTAEIAATLTHPNGARPGLNHMIPTVSPVQHPHADLPIDPYLLGVWLGDGSADGRITSTPDIFAAVEETGASWLTRSNCTSPEVRTAGCVGLTKALRQLGLLGKRSYEKSVPAQYMHASIEQRLALLQGLLDTDGTVSKGNAIVFDITSKALADSVSELVRSLGGTVTRSEKDGKLKGVIHRRVYRVFISMPEGIAPFRLQYHLDRYQPDWTHKNRQTGTRRFIKSVEPAGMGEAVCITVAHTSKLFVTRDHIVTHNSTVCAWVIVWWMSTRHPQKSICTAPTSGQLFDALFAEVKTWFNRLPPVLLNSFDVFSDRITIKGEPESSFVSARTSSAERPEALAGIHSEHVLLIADEASAIPEAIFESAAGSMSGENACTILIGNPTRSTGFFFKTHHALKNNWHTMHVSCVDNPLVTKDFVSQIATTYGENSNAFRVRVLGEFPIKDDDTLIAAELVESAMDRDVAPRDLDPLVFGVDVARFGSDRTVICKRKGHVVLDFKVASGLDLMQTAGLVASEYRLDNPAEIMVDSIGLGAGVADRLRELGLPVRDVNVSESSAMNPNAHRLRDELWIALRDWLQAKACKLPTNDDLRADLLAPRYTFTSSGKIVVETKDSMKKRGLRSPDLADSLCLTFAGQAAIVGGRSQRWRTGEPMRRNLKGVV